MTVRGGRRGAAATDGGALAARAACTLVAMAGWLLLVRAAIFLGRAGRAGDGSAWVQMALAVAGAILCLVVSMALALRTLSLLGVLSDYEPKRARRD